MINILVVKWIDILHLHHHWVHYWYLLTLWDTSQSIVIWIINLQRNLWLQNFLLWSAMNVIHLFYLERLSTSIAIPWLPTFAIIPTCSNTVFIITIHTWRTTIMTFSALLAFSYTLSTFWFMFLWTIWCLATFLWSKWVVVTIMKLYRAFIL